MPRFNINPKYQPDFRALGVRAQAIQPHLDTARVRMVTVAKNIFGIVTGIVLRLWSFFSKYTYVLYTIIAIDQLSKNFKLIRDWDDIRPMHGFDNQFALYAIVMTGACFYILRLMSQNWGVHNDDFTITVNPVIPQWALALLVPVGAGFLLLSLQLRLQQHDALRQFASTRVAELSTQMIEISVLVGCAVLAFVVMQLLQMVMQKFPYLLYFFLIAFMVL